MDNINLDDGKIHFGGEWLSVEDLTKKIQDKMQAGDMKFADMAGALETLNKKLEDSHPLEVKLVLTKDDYSRLKDLGEADDRECIRRAIMAFIGAENAGGEGNETAAENSLEDKKKKARVKCANCDSPFEVQIEPGNDAIKCSNCGAVGYIKVPGQDDQPVAS
jgi:hypothetical protein